MSMGMDLGKFLVIVFRDEMIFNPNPKPPLFRIYIYIYDQIYFLYNILYIIKLTLIKFLYSTYYCTIRVGSESCCVGIINVSSVRANI